MRRPIKIAVAQVVDEVKGTTMADVVAEAFGGSSVKVDYAGVIKKYKGKINNRASAIRAMCVECSGGALSEVRNCTVVKCALYGFRNGDDPYRKKRTDGFAAGKTEEEGEEE